MQEPSGSPPRAPSRTGRSTESPFPGRFAAEDELFGIGAVLGELGTGVFELAPAGALGEDLAAPEKEMSWMRRLSAAIGRPVTFALNQNNNDPDAYRRLLELAADAAADGIAVRPQVHGRTVSLLLGLQTFHPFNFAPSWARHRACSDWNEQVVRMGDPNLRARLVSELTAMEDDPIVSGFMHPSRTFPARRPARLRARTFDQHRPIGGRGGSLAVGGVLRPPPPGRRTPAAQCSGPQLLRREPRRRAERCSCTRRPFSGWETVARMRARPATRAPRRSCCPTGHVTVTTDACRSKKRCASSRAPRPTSSVSGDRGRLVPGKKADLNIIDFEQLGLQRPTLVADLPGVRSGWCSAAPAMWRRSTGVR